MKHYFQSLGIEIKNQQLYHTALTHKSFGNEENVENNERLEFLGDAVLELAITEALFKKYKNLPEGELTALRSALVRKESLAQCAQEINLGEHIKLSSGEKRTQGNQKDYILANTVEALLGALYLDRGFLACKKFIEQYLMIKVEKIHEKKSHIGPKTLFQEYAQAHLSLTPTYKVLSEEGPDHQKIFTVGAYLGKEKVGEGQGASKQKGENAAALDAYEKLTQ
jgi:ribonuclease-3